MKSYIQSSMMKLLCLIEQLRDEAKWFRQGREEVEDEARSSRQVIETISRKYGTNPSPY